MIQRIWLNSCQRVPINLRLSHTTVKGKIKGHSVGKNGEINYFNLTLVVVISLTIVGLVCLATNENLSTKSIVVSETRLMNVPGNAEICFIEKQDSQDGKAGIKIKKQQRNGVERR